MAKRAGHKKNRPTFFSLLVTLLFVAAGVFGVYKVRPYLASQNGLISAFLQEKETSTKPTDKPDTSAPEETSAPADEDAAAVAQAIGKADGSLSPAFLTYCADNFSAETLQKVLDAMEDKTYTPETWFTATGRSIHAINALADGDVKNGIVIDKTNEKKTTIDLLFAGKVNPALAEKAAGSVSADLLETMQKSDIRVAGNECVFSKDGDAAFRAAEKRAAVYAEMGVDVVSLAGLHISDYGSAGTTSTAAALDEAGVAHVGAGKDENAASTPVWFLAGGRKIALIGTAQTPYWKKTQAAGKSSAGVFSLTASGAAVLKAVETAKADSDYVFVYMSAGVDENASWFDSEQSGWARRLIDAGADGVVGAHSNKVQGMEYYKNKLIVYGLGDLWYDSASRDSVLYRVTIAKDGTFTHSVTACTQQDGKASLAGSGAATFDRIEKYCGNVVQISSDGTVKNNRR